MKKKSMNDQLVEALDDCLDELNCSGSIADKVSFIGKVERLLAKAKQQRSLRNHNRAVKKGI